MYIARGLLILSFGSMLRITSCFSDGGLLADQCQAMNINHPDGNDIDIPAQDTEYPFKVEPESVKLNVSMPPIPVTLSGGPGFSGFMLDSREKDNGPSVGTFSLEDLDNTQLICGGSVVVHVNNLNKNSIRVLWTPPPAAPGLKTQTQEFFFRAAVVENYSKFWRRKPIIITSTTPPPSETGTSTAPPISEANSTDLTTTTTKFTTSNKDSQAPALPTAPMIPEPSIIQTNPATDKRNLEVKNEVKGNRASWSISQAISINITSGTSIFVSISNVFQAPVYCSCRNLWDPLNTLYAVLMFWSYIFLL
ncbi:putative ferric-chelate reductase 1 [Pimephales promelas]|uniref:putative ferric-chelate reductase 1 n=1 Tax=Pimephales promelas TaxID=90988 RepID=UPI0019558621|nr:putative ferric-chelate reductase 1 [Pimephales promelas]